MSNLLPTPFTFSQSSLQDYSDCPRRFQLRYLEELSWPAIESEPVVEFERRQQEGRLFHHLVQQHVLALPADRLTRLASSDNLQRWWRNYLSADLGILGYAQNAEFALSAPIGEHRILAKYDLVAVKDGKAIILDWKTFAHRPRAETLSSHWQTRVYPSLLVKAGSNLNNDKAFDPRAVSMVYWLAEHPSEPVTFNYDVGHLKRDWSAIERLVAEISIATDFPLTDDDKMCRFCLYRSHCDRHVPAADWRDSEVDRVDPVAFDINFEQIGEIEF